MSLCILAGGKLVTLAVSAFTLAWTHSVQHTRWEEDWRVSDGGLQLAEARINGSAAGMEPPPDAVLRDGWWSYVPDLPPLPELVLAASGSTGGGWQLCAADSCMTLGAVAEEPVRLTACEGSAADLAHDASQSKSRHVEPFGSMKAVHVAALQTLTKPYYAIFGSLISG